MRHQVSARLIPKRILIALCVLTFASIQAPSAFGQRGGGGHVSAPHMSAPPRMAAPPRPAPAPQARPPMSRPMPSAPPRVIAPPVASQPVPAPQMRPPISRPLSSNPPLAGFGTPGFPAHRFPVRPGPPFRPVVRPPIIVPPVFVSPSFPGFGLGFGFGFGINSFWPYNCGPAFFWQFGCGVGPAYGYGLGYYGPYTGPTYSNDQQPYVGPVYPAPLNLYGGAERDLAELFMKDGTVYDVLDYWVVDNQLHFTINEGGDSPTEHVVSLDDLDMQKTIDVNTQRGFNFTLRNEPIDQYLQDHPEVGSPSTTAPGATLQYQSPATQDQPPADQHQSPPPSNEPQSQPILQSPARQ